MTDLLNAATSDPLALGVMAGFPPDDGAVVRLADGTSWKFPQTRWSFSHQRELGPTAAVRRGPGAASPLPRGLRDDLDGVAFTTLDGQAMTWGEAAQAVFSDGLMVLHKGVVVQERYFGALEPHRPHLAMSITKSFTGLLAAMLAHEGVLDVAAPVSLYVPELAGGAYGDASVRQVMDMTIGVQYSEVYSDPDAEVHDYAAAAGMSPPRAGSVAPRCIFDFLRGLKKEGEHGQAFAYKTVNTEVLGWIVQRAAGAAWAEQVSARIWRWLGAEEDAYVLVDGVGAAVCGAGLNLTLRDMARFGEMMRLGGRFNDAQIVPEAVVTDIAGGGERAHFAKAGYATLPGWSYRSQWWVAHNALGAFTARGIHGQVVYVAPGAEMVVARFASHPTAANGNGPLDRLSLPAYEALAAHLMRTG